jgi:hypothetical protein
MFEGYDVDIRFYIDSVEYEANFGDATAPTVVLKIRWETRTTGFT